MSTTLHLESVARPAAEHHRLTTGRPHRPLLALVVVMVALAAFSAVGMIFDDRMLLGESVWLKPFKFAVAFGLYSGTLAWLLSLPHKGSRATWWLGTVFAVTGCVDVGFIVVQAARGTFSHFNTQTDVFNDIGQKVFASGVPGLFFANLVIAVILSWQRVADRPLSRAIHAGMGLAVAGMMLGYLMGFTGKQLVRDADGNIVELAAGHTVLHDTPVPQARDALAGLPITHWSTVGGDLRVPHFVGLHGIQVLILAAVALGLLAPRVRWLRDERARARVVGVLAIGYAGLLAIVFQQAMRAQPLIHPDTITVAAFGGLVAVIGLLLTAVYAHGRNTIGSLSAAVPLRG
ncbi:MULTISPECIES: hypothetical protein [unclassified Nocardia]|uniref:hypothetical protein n=1 Tax=unclassified Nocardia TaxID=2637762 RepID=UPI001CE46B05|nr:MULTISPECIES: hypothetical protein [unclassified Nocardia]